MHVHDAEMKDAHCINIYICSSWYGVLFADKNQVNLIIIIWQVNDNIKLKREKEGEREWEREKQLDEHRLQGGDLILIQHYAVFISYRRYSWL